MNHWRAADTTESQRWHEEHRVDANPMCSQQRKTTMFSMKAGGSGGEYKNATPGAVGAVLTRIIDLGTQQTTFGEKRQVRLSWEIDEQMSDGRPFLVSRTVTTSFHEKATLRKLIEGWRGRKFTDGEDFEMSKLLGQPALLNLIESEGGYTNIDSVSRLPHGMSPIEPAGDLMIFSLDEPDWSVYEKLHDKLQEKIAQAPEFSGSKREPTAPHYVEEQPAPSATDQYAKLRSRPTGSGAPLPQAAAPPTRPAPPTEFNDDIPF